MVETQGLSGAEALLRVLQAVAQGQLALIDIRLASVLETTEPPDRAN